MVLNAGKCYYMCLGRNAETAVPYFSDETCANSKDETILGIMNENKLSFYCSLIMGLSKRPLKSSLLYPELHLI